MDNSVVIEEQSTAIEINEQASLVEVSGLTENTVIEVSTDPSLLVIKEESPPQVIEVYSPGIQGPRGFSGSSSPFTGPEFQYEGDQLTRIDYDDGSYQLFFYTGTSLASIELYISGGDNKRKDFVYDGDVLIRIDESNF